MIFCLLFYHLIEENMSKFFYFVSRFWSSSIHHRNLTVQKKGPSSLWQFKSNRMLNIKSHSSLSLIKGLVLIQKRTPSSPKEFRRLTKNPNWQEWQLTEFENEKSFPKMAWMIESRQILSWFRKDGKTQVMSRRE